MGSFQRQESQAGLQTKEVPGVFGTPKSAEIAQGIEGRIGRQSPLQQILEGALLQGQTTAGETGLSSAISDIVGGGGQDLSKALATALVSERQTGIGGLQRGATLQQAENEQAIRGLLELAGLAMPQVVGGQVSRGVSGPPGLFGDPVSQFASSGDISSFYDPRKIFKPRGGLF